MRAAIQQGLGARYYLKPSAHNQKGPPFLF